MLVGYARTSTTQQKYSLEAQIESLNAAGCEKVFSEQVSAVSSDRDEFEAALEFVREGDVLVVCKLDRFARSIRDLTKQIDRLETKKERKQRRRRNNNQQPKSAHETRAYL